MKICIGHGTGGEIIEDLEKVKACNFCTRFRGIGAHWLTGQCMEDGKTLFMTNYSKEAKGCDKFECKPNLIRSDDDIEVY